MQIEIVPQRRRALYSPYTDRPSLSLKKNEPVECHVLGLYPAYDKDEGDVYFIIELLNGRCTYASPDTIQFVDIDERGVIIE